MEGAGKLVLIPTPLGDNEPLEVLPFSVKKHVIGLKIFIVENEKSARHFLKKIGILTPQDELVIHILNKYTPEEEYALFLEPCLHGENVGLLSEAGLPAIADPGADIVQIAHDKEIEVFPLIGPSSILLGLMSSGLNGQSFAFNGYLPIDKKDRSLAIKAFEKKSASEGQAQIFIETPYRNDALLQNLLKVLRPTTRLCVACDLTLPSQWIKSALVESWLTMGALPELSKRPSIFMYQANG
jgi:16S rRNA (cytidine1402-2'-O)-methyltransferase